MAKPRNIVPSIPDRDFAYSHRAAFLVEVLGIADEVLDEIPIVGGSVSFDARASTRASCSIQVPRDYAGTYLPLNPDSLLAPYGNELRISRGIEYHDRIDLVRLGIFQIEQSELSDSPSETISVSGPDRSGWIVDAAFEAPFEVPSGWQVDDAIKIVVAGGRPQTEFLFQETDVPLPNLRAEEGEDRWAFAQGLATSIGGQLYFDGAGVLRLEPIVFPGGAAEVILEEGAGGVLLGASRQWDRAPVYNKVIVTGENSSEVPVRGERYDDNPLSPTFYGGKFGKKPKFWSSSDITREEEAYKAAGGLLAQTLGAPDVISFQSITNANWRPNTMMKIVRHDLATNETHIVDSLQMPLDVSGEMSGNTRAVALEIA